MRFRLRAPCRSPTEPAAARRLMADSTTVDRMHRPDNSHTGSCGSRREAAPPDRQKPTRCASEAASSTTTASLQVHQALFERPSSASHQPEQSVPRSEPCERRVHASSGNQSQLKSAATHGVAMPPTDPEDRLPRRLRFASADRSGTNKPTKSSVHRQQSHRFAERDAEQRRRRCRRSVADGSASG
jgi:hypothetical protein